MQACEEFLVKLYFKATRLTLLITYLIFKAGEAAKIILPLWFRSPTTVNIAFRGSIYANTFNTCIKRTHIVTDNVVSRQL